MLRAYENILLSNASQITAVESSLRSITYFLPGRFPDSELAGEAVYSALNLLGLYHDSILVRLLSPSPIPRSLGPPSCASPQSSNYVVPAASSSLPSTSTTTAPPATYSKLQHTPSLHARYTHHFSDSSPAYRTLARALVIVGYTELLAEMMARRRLGQKQAWNVVAGIESVKAALRLALLHLSENRTSIQPPIPEREVDPAMLEEDRKAALSKILPHAGEQVEGGPPLSKESLAYQQQEEEVWRGTRTGYARPTLSSIRSKSQQSGGGSGVNAANSTTGPNRIRSSSRNHPLTTSSSQHLGASTSSHRGRLNGGSSASASDSDSDETLVDSWTEREVNDYLVSRTLTPNDVRQPQDLVRPLRGNIGYTAELIWILRPLLYVLALRRWGTKHKTPFIISIVLEYLARSLRLRSFNTPGSSCSNQRAFASNPLMMAMMGENPVLGLLAGLLGRGAAGAKEARPISDVEKLEWERRNRAFWWYLLRGPVWHSWTRHKLDSIVKRTQQRPLLGIVGGFIGDYLPLVDEYYYYSAT